jgi:hypothetical protein
MLARHLCCLSIAIIGVLGRRRRRAAIALAAYAIRVSVFVGAVRDVAPFGGIDWFFSTALSLTHVVLLQGEPPRRADGMP